VLRKALTKTIIPIAIFLSSFVFLSIPILKAPLLTGIDGPYYAIQVRWILQYGRLKYPDPPLTFILMTFMTLLVKNTFLGIKLTVLIFTSLASLPWYFLFSNRNKILSGVASSLSFIINWYSLRLASDFMKNSIGLLWLSLYVFFMFQYFQKNDRKSLILLVISFILTALTHILDLGIAIFYSLTIPFLYFILYRKIDKKTVIILLLSLSTIVIGLTLPMILGGDIYKGIAFVEDLIEENNFVVVRAQNFILSIGMFLTLITVSLILLKKDKLSLLFFASGILALLLNLPIIPRKWLFRFQLMNMIPLSLSIGSALYLTEKDYKTFPIIIFITTLLLFSSIGTYNLVRPTIIPPEYQELKMIVKSLEEKGYTIIIPDVKIRYWAETFSDKVYKSPKDINTKIVFLFRIHAKKPPIFTKPLWIGHFFIAYSPRNKP